MANEVEFTEDAFGVQVPTDIVGKDEFHEVAYMKGSFRLTCRFYPYPDALHLPKQTQVIKFQATDGGYTLDRHNLGKLAAVLQEAPYDFTLIV